MDLENCHDAWEVAQVYLWAYKNKDVALRQAVLDWMEGSLTDMGESKDVKAILWHIATDPPRIFER